MAYYQMEPWGSHYDDLRVGAIASLIANIHRDKKRQADPFGNLDFIPWNDVHRAAQDVAPVLLDDPDAQADLIDRMMFPKRS